MFIQSILTDVDQSVNPICLAILLLLTKLADNWVVRQ